MFFIPPDYSIPEIEISGTSSESYIMDRFLGDKGWDLDALRERQTAYFEHLKLYNDYTITNGVPNSILELMPLITKVAMEKGLDPTLIASIIRSESFGYKYAVGGKGELGLMQINVNAHGIKLTKEQYADIFDPETNIRLGASILKGCLERFDGNPTLALEAYNAGLERVLEKRVPKETKGYSRSTLKNERQMNGR